MLTANYVGDHTISIREADAADPGPGEVQIAVAYTGLCGTDLHIVHGTMDARVSTPLIFGHEMSGTIAMTNALETRPVMNRSSALRRPSMMLEMT